MDNCQQWRENGELHLIVTEQANKLSQNHSQLKILIQSVVIMKITICYLLLQLLHAVTSICFNQLKLINITSTKALLMIQSQEKCNNLTIYWKLVKLKACQEQNFQEKSKEILMTEFREYFLVENLLPFSIYNFRY